MSNVKGYQRDFCLNPYQTIGLGYIDSMSKRAMTDRICLLASSSGREHQTWKTNLKRSRKVLVVLNEETFKSIEYESNKKIRLTEKTVLNDE